MIVMLDAHALLWWWADDGRLGQPARRSLANPGNDVLVSAATIWEIAVKQRAGRLEAPKDLLGPLETSRIGVVSVDGRDAEAAASLPMHHRDPFDRMLIAQAQRLEALVVTRDRAFASYDVHVLVA